MPDLTLLSPEDLEALASKNVNAMSEEGRQIAFGDLNKQPVPEDIETDDISNVRKFAYGFEKTKSDVGLLYRTLQVKAGLGKIDGFDYIPAEGVYTMLHDTFFEACNYWGSCCKALNLVDVFQRHKADGGRQIGGF